jgi:hypothetical protein
MNQIEKTKGNGHFVKLPQINSVVRLQTPAKIFPGVPL